jgi:hypothetical protein
MNELHIDIVIAFILGCSFCFHIIKKLITYAVMRALKGLERIYDKVQDIEKKLAVMSVNLDKVSEHEHILKIHSKKIAYLEGINDKSKRSQ